MSIRTQSISISGSRTGRASGQKRAMLPSGLQLAPAVVPCDAQGPETISSSAAFQVLPCCLCMMCTSASANLQCNHHLLLMGQICSAAAF